MKKLGVILFSLFATSSFAMIKSFPNGKYTGQGYWKETTGKTGNYKVELTITDNKFEHKLTFDDGSVIEEKGSATFDEHGFVTLSNERGEKSGEGYCGTVWCHFQITGAPAFREDVKDAEETYAFVDGQIFRIGSMVYEGVKFFWEDALQIAK